MQRFNIYIKSKKFNWTIDKLVLLIFVIGIIFWRTNEHFPDSKYYSQIDKILMYTFLFVFIGGTFYKYSKLGRPGKLNGNFEGFLEFKLNSIVIDQKEYTLDEIEKIEIVNGDYYGRPTGSGRGFDSNFSNGIDNRLTLILKNKQKVDCQFELYYEYDMGKVDDILINYYNSGKLNFDQLLKIFKIKSKKEIEDFKQSLKNATTTNSG